MELSVDFNGEICIPLNLAVEIAQILCMTMTLHFPCSSQNRSDSILTLLNFRFKIFHLPETDFNLKLPSTLLFSQKC